MKHLVLALATLTLSTQAGAVDYKIDVNTLLAQKTLVGTFTIKNMDELGGKLAEVFPKAAAELQKAGVQPTGAPFTRYLQFDPGTVIEVEAGFPVASAVAVAVDSGLAMSELPAGQVATTLHVGPYEKVGDAYDAILKWIADNKKEITGAPWEVYLNDPGEVAPEQFQTQVYFPIK